MTIFSLFKTLYYQELLYSSFFLICSDNQGFTIFLSGNIYLFFFLCKEKLMRETRERYPAPAKKMSSPQESVFCCERMRLRVCSSVGNAQISFPQFNKKKRGLS
jgi:hypothetical protein